MRLLLILLMCFSFTQVMGQKEEEVTGRMKADISYLASDMLEGRLTGSIGESKSSLYIADEFRKYKLTPKGNDSGSYLQNFSIVRLRINQTNSYFLWTEENMLMNGFKPKSGDFYPMAQSCNRDSIGKTAVYQAGYGIVAPELNHNDYADTNGIRGKVFVIKLGSPEAGVAHGKYEAYEGMNYKVDLAVKMGARAVVFVIVDSAIEAPKGKLDRNVKPRSIPVVFAAKEAQSILKAKDITFSVNILQVNATAHNVIGFINNKKAKTIVIGAHQDHLGYNEFGGSRYTGGGEIHNGADDNASGVAMMLELMREIKKNKKLRKNNYLFIAFSGEEQGLLGSNYFVKNPTIDVKSILYMLNFDMVGRLDSMKKTLMIYGVGTSPVWKTALTKLKTDSTEIRIKTTESGTGASDHTNFYYENKPVLHFFTGQHYDYHMPSDDEKLINYHGMYQVLGVTMQMIKAVNKTKDFPFTTTKSEESEKMTFKVTLGIMPDYVFDGTGVRIDGVNQGKPAQNAGLLKGDIILKLGDFQISSMQDYMRALGKFTKGQTTTIKIKRGDKELDLPLTF